MYAPFSYPHGVSVSRYYRACSEPLLTVHSVSHVRHHVPHTPDIPKLPPPLTPFHYCLPAATEINLSYSFRILREFSPITEHISHDLCLCRLQPVAFDLPSPSNPCCLARVYGTPPCRPSETPKASGPSATASVSGTAEHSEMRNLLD